VKRGAPITAGVLVGAAAMMLSGLVSGGSLLLAGPVAAHAANVAASVLMAAMGAGIFSRVGSRPLWL